MDAMEFARRKSCALALLLGAVLCSAQTISLPKDADAGVKRYTLPNGLRVFIVPNNLAPVVTVEENYLVGGDETPADFPGRTRTQLTVSYGCDPVNVSKARTLIERDLTAMQTAPPSAGEMQQAVAMLLREIPLQQSSESSIADGLLARAVVGLPLDEPVRAAERYKSISAEQVRAAFAKWIRPADFVQVVQGPTPK